MSIVNTNNYNATIPPIGTKRKPDDSDSTSKRIKSDLVPYSSTSASSTSTQLITVNSTPTTENKSVGRSTLPSPLLTLTGHVGPIYSSRFHSSGRFFASVGADPSIFLWSYPLSKDQNLHNYATIPSHKLTTLDCDFHATEPYLYTASADQTVHIYDIETGTRTRNFRFHKHIVNTVRAIKPNNKNNNLFLSGSNDGKVHIYDAQSKHLIHKIKHQTPVLSVEISENQYYYAGLDHHIYVNDLRTHKLLYKLESHTNSVVNLSLNHESNYLLSTSFDNTLKSWDIQPFCNQETRLLRTYSGAAIQGVEHDLIKSVWSNDSEYIISGSVDRCVWIWKTETAAVEYRLPGHKGTVLTVDYHPKQQVIMSGAQDRTIILGEL